MVDKSEIPPPLICRICGEPMQVESLAALAGRLGLSGSAEGFIISCCDRKLIIEDPLEAAEMRELLIRYHRRQVDPS